MSNDDGVDETRDMERRTLQRLSETARLRGVLDERRRLETRAARDGFRDGVATGAEEAAALVARHLAARATQAPPQSDGASTDLTMQAR